MCLCHVGRWEETRVHRGAGKKGQECTMGPHAAICCPTCHRSHVPTHRELPAHALPWGLAPVPWQPTLRWKSRRGVLVSAPWPSAAAGLGVLVLQGRSQYSPEGTAAGQ